MSDERRSLTDALVNDLLDLFRDDVVRVGTKLPSESELIERFGVSRTVVREAISQLKARGLVSSQQGRGSFLLALPGPAPGSAQQRPLPGDLDETLRFLEFRCALEEAAAGYAATRATAAQLQQVRTALDVVNAAENPARSVAADLDFHLAIAKASQNAYLADELVRMGPAMLAIPPHRLDAGHDDLMLVAAEHGAIVRAIEHRDAVAARAAMHLHLTNSAARLQTQLRPDTR